MKIVGILSGVKYLSVSESEGVGGGGGGSCDSGSNKGIMAIPGDGGMGEGKRKLLACANVACDIEAVA